MFDYIRRDDAIKAITYNYDEVLSVSDAVYVLDTLPSADLEPVVRCKNCKHFEPLPEEDTGFCFSFTYRQMPKDGYCYYGERKKDDG